MAKHMVKCLYCGQMFDINAEPYIKPSSNRYAHKSCADRRTKEQTEEEKDKEILYIYIKELFGDKAQFERINKQIRTYVNENHYSYSGIYKTLRYFYEVKGNSIEKANGGIGIVPYVYNEACQYHRALWEAQQKNRDKIISDYVIPNREIRVVPPQRAPMRHLRKLFSFLEE